MPRRSSNAARREVSKPDPDERPILVPPNEVDPQDKEAFWLNLVNDLPTFRENVKTMSFWRLVSELPAALWERSLLIYAYRLEPKVKNSTGAAYMEKMNHAVDEEYFRQYHGGGKYMLYLKCGDESIKEITFSIDGAPKLQSGVIRVDEQGNALPPPAPAVPSEPITQVIEATSAAAKANADMLRSGYDRILETQNKVMEQRLGVSGDEKKDTLSDKILDAVITKALNPPDPMQMLSQVLTIVKEMTPRQPAQRENPEPHSDLSGQLALVKEMFGVEKLSELGDKIKGKDGISWPEVVQTMLQQGPAILAQMMQMQRENWQRMMFMRGQGQPGALGLPATAPGAPAAGIPGASVPRAPEAPAAGSQAQMAATLNQVVPQMVAQIADNFDRGFSGSDCACALDINFRNMLEQLAPMLGNPATLADFIRQVPELAQRSGHADWAEFQQDFCEYVQDKYPQAQPPVNGAAVPKPPAAATVEPLKVEQVSA